MKKALTVFVSACLLVPPVLAQQPDRSTSNRADGFNLGPVMVSRMIQDEIQDLPADHSALFSASREISIALNVPSVGELAGLENALVTVIRPNGDVTELRPNINGLVTVEQVEEGPHAFVVASERAHGAKLVYAQQAPEQEVVSVAPPQLTLLDVSGEQLRSFMDQLSDVSGPFSDLNAEAQIGPEFGYRVALDQEGIVRGTVLPIADRTGGTRLQETRIAVFFRGIQVAETVCDESGEFTVRGMSPGIHGVIAAGPEGYTAFAMDVVSSDTEIAMSDHAERLVTRMAAPSPQVPVVLIPPPMIPGVVAAIRLYYGLDQFVPFSGTAVGPSFGGGYASGSGGGGGGGGGGAFVAAAGMAAILAADDGNRLIFPRQIASPVLPGIPAIGVGN